VSASPLSHLFNEELYTIPPTVTIIVSQPWESISEDQKTLLSKILGSVKISLASSRIVHRLSMTDSELKELGSQKVLLFGTQAQVAPYEHVQAQGFSIIRADELGALDDAKKKSLWLALKTMFAA
jgi:hypothetical protein